MFRNLNAYIFLITVNATISTEILFNIFFFLSSFTKKKKELKIANLNNNSDNYNLFANESKEEKKLNERKTFSCVKSTLNVLKSQNRKRKINKIGGKK